MDNNPRNFPDLVVLQPKPSEQPLMKINRWFIGALLLFMTLIVVSGFWLFPEQEFTVNYQKATGNIVYVSENNPQLSVELNALKSQFVGLLSGSIENKLRSLEENLKAGNLNHSLGTITDLKYDVEILRHYAEPIPATTSVQPATTDAQLIHEMSQLKRLLYWLSASCSLLFAAIAGVWFKNLKKLPTKQTIIRYLTRQ